jgi:predicted DCC family thiol-disulfide oxidoreductase YuxK
MTAASETRLFLYDGNCGFCTAAVRWMQQKLKLHGVLIAYHSQEIAAFTRTTTFFSTTGLQV